MHEVEARSLFMAFHLEIITISPQVLVFGAHAMRLQVVRNDIKSICIWHRWKWKNLTRKHNKQCSCGALSKDEIFALFLLLCILMTAVRALEMLNFTPLNGKPIRIMYSHCDLEYARAELETFLLRSACCGHNWRKPHSSCTEGTSRRASIQIDVEYVIFLTTLSAPTSIITTCLHQITAARHQHFQEQLKYPMT